MDAPAGRHVSPWIDTMPAAELGSTGFRDVPVDVVVVGAGVTGMTTALLLQQAGRKVAVVEAERFGRSVTTQSTVKVTFGHGARYSAIADAVGLDAATTYADANVAGFRTILDLAGSLNIECSLETGLPHVVYAEQAENAEQVEREAEAARQVGLSVTLDAEAPLPFPVAAALSFPDQAIFHPGQYLVGLAEAFVRAGGIVMENVRAHGVDEQRNRCRIETDAGTLTAASVVVATQYPILNRGAQFTRLTTRRSYGVAGVLPAGVPAGMTLGLDPSNHSTRTARLGGEDLLIVVGKSHEVGHVSDTAKRWVELQDWARDRFGVADFRYHWSAQDVNSIDHLPFVGVLNPGSERVFTATGFGAWGMTNGTAAAMLIRDLILGRENRWVEHFDAKRSETTLPGKKALKQNVHVAKTWVKDRVGGAPAGSVRELRPGQAEVFEHDGEPVAAYRDDAGAVHAVSAVCTHMRCNVAWNDGERSWDCPCHGSRFGPDGEVLHGPATRPLPGRELT